MIDHAPDCEVLLPGGVCTCRGPKITEPHPHLKQEFGPNPTPEKLLAWHRARAGTSRTVDTEPKITWLGKDKHEHPRFCGVYMAREANWAPYCTCYIAALAAETGKKPRPEVNGYVAEPAEDIPSAFDVPKEYRPTGLPWGGFIGGIAGGLVGGAVGFVLGVNWPL